MRSWSNVLRAFETVLVMNQFRGQTAGAVG